MFAASVNAGKRLFVEQTNQTVPLGHGLQQLHCQLIMVAGHVGVAVDRRVLMLGRCHLIVLRFGEDTQLPQLHVQFVHERGDSGLNGTVIVVVQLLTLGRLCTEQRPAAQPQIFPAAIVLLVDQEVFLLRAYLGDHALGFRIAEQPQNADALLIQRVHGAQQRRLLVQRIAGVGAEDGGNAQRSVLHKGIGRGIPCGIAAGLKGGPQTAGGEAGGVGLAAAQLLAGQFHQDAPIPGGRDKAVVLLGGKTGHWLEPVGEMGSAQLSGPILHGRGDLISNGTVQRLPLCLALLPSLISVSAETLSHLLLGKHHAAENIGDFRHVLVHCIRLLSPRHARVLITETGS